MEKIGYHHQLGKKPIPTYDFNSLSYSDGIMALSAKAKQVVPAYLT